MNARALLLPVFAAVLVSLVLGVQVANGGGDFTPARSADPCVVRAATSASTGLDGLGERLVVLGLDRAACRLHVSREALILDLAQPDERTDTELAALHSGLLDAVTLIKQQGTLPKASTLADEAVKQADLPFLVRAAIRVLPDSVIDAGLKTDDVLRRTVDNLDLRKLFANLNDPDAISHQLQSAVTDAVKDSLIARLRSLIP